jgi:hypothetical protein
VSSSIRTAGRLLLLATTLASPLASPLAAQPSSGGTWRFAIRAEEARFGTYFGQRTTETLVEQQGTLTGTVSSRLSLAPMRGARATVTRLAPTSDWGLRAELGWGRGAYGIDMSSTATSGGLVAMGTSMSAESLMFADEDASYWSGGIGAVRRLGAAESRVRGSVGVHPSLTVLRVPFVSDPPTPLPPSLGGFTLDSPPSRTHSYTSPGAVVSATVAATIWRGVALELSTSAGIHRTPGDAVARDLAKVPWRLTGPAPSATGSPQWRPVTMFGIGVGVGGGF